jgi:hypothetical protein
LLLLNKYLKIYWLLLASIFLFKNSFSQNLISNGSFEISTNVDCYGGFYNGTFPNAHTLVDWYQYNSPDYFNSVCGAGGYSVPNGYFGYSNAKNGNAYVGISLYQGVNSEYKEYFYQQLQTVLVAGKVYCLSFYITRADRKEYAVKQIGAYFSNSLPTLISFSYINAVPQVENQGGIISDTTQWTLIQGCFTANGGEEYITIGNFNSNVNTDTLNTGTNNPIIGDPQYSYYYIDDISLIDQTTVGINELEEENSFEIYPNPSNGRFEITCSVRGNYIIEITNAIGQIIKTLKVQQSKTDIDLSNELAGLYFCNLTQNGKTLKQSKIVVIK